MPLTKDQEELLSSLSTSYTSGLSQSAVAQLRVVDDGSNDANKLKPPVDCPAWACILLPCIKYIPSMKLFQQIQPHDAEVMRDGNWICYDAASLVRGDIIRLSEGDTVPADCTVLSLGMDHDFHDSSSSATSDSSRDGDKSKQNKVTIDEDDEFVVDLKNIIGEMKPRSVYRSNPDGTRNTVDSSVKLFCGGQVLQGSAIAVVTSVGSKTVLASLIRERRWPPSRDISMTIDDRDTALREGRQSLLGGQVEIV